MAKITRRSVLGAATLYGFLRASSRPARADPDVENKPSSRSLLGIEDAVNAVVFSGDGNRIAAGGQDRSLRVWNASTGTPILSLLDLGGPVVAVALNSDGSQVAASGWAGAHVKKDFHTSGIHGGGEGRTTISWRGAVFKSWVVDTGKLIQAFTNEPPMVKAIAFSNDGGLLSVIDATNAFTAWRTTTGKQFLSIDRLKPEDPSIANIYVASFCGSGLRAASVDRSGPLGRLNVWNLETSGTRSFQCDSDAISTLAMSRDGRLIATGSRDHRISIHDFSTGNNISHLRGGVDGSPVALAFSPDGQLVASGGDDGVVRVWIVSDGRLLETLDGPNKNGVRQVVFTADGLRAVSGGYQHASERDLKTGRFKTVPLTVWDLKLTRRPTKS